MSRWGYVYGPLVKYGPSGPNTCRRYIDADLRARPERLQFAVKIAQAYHDDWPPMVEAAHVARHEQTLAVPVARMVLNWARTQPEPAGILTDFEWSLLEEDEQQAVVIDFEEEQQRRELARRRTAAEKKRYFIEVPVKIKTPFMIAPNGKVAHAPDNGASFIRWRKYDYRTNVFLPQPVPELWFRTMCGGPQYSLPQWERSDLPPCQSGCWETIEEAADRRARGEKLEWLDG